MTASVTTRNINDRDEVKWERVELCSSLQDAIQNESDNGEIAGLKVELLKLLGIYGYVAKGCWVDCRPDKKTHVYLYRKAYFGYPRDNDGHGHVVIQSDGSVEFMRLPGDPRYPDRVYYLPGYAPVRGNAKVAS